MAKMCRRLSAVERVRIELREGLSLTRIAEAIGQGTVSKEIARHGGGMPPTLSRAWACRAAAAHIG
jgi:hypothetical protein